MALLNGSDRLIIRRNSGVLVYAGTLGEKLADIASAGEVDLSNYVTRSTLNAVIAQNPGPPGENGQDGQDGQDGGLVSPAFRAVLTASPTITDTSNPVLVEFDSVLTYHGASWGGGILPPVHFPDDGLWLYHFRMAFQANIAAVMFLYLNSGGYQQYQLPNNSNYGQLSALIETEAGDTVSGYVVCPSEVTIQGGSLWTSLHGVKVG